MSLIKKFISEAIGTFVLVFFACGTAALTFGDLTSTSLAFGLVIIAMAYSIGRISGCHINPAVSLGCLLTKRMSLKEFIFYILGQFLGGFLGAMLLFGIFKMADMSAVGDACNNYINFNDINDINAGQIIATFLVELVLTAIFVYVILNVTDSKNEGVAKFAGIIIGLTLTLVHLVGINFTGTSVNPARSFATAMGAAIFNSNTDPLAELWVFITAPLAGGVLAALMYRLIHSEK